MTGTGYYRSGTTFLFMQLQALLKMAAVTNHDVSYYHSLISDHQAGQTEAKRVRLTISSTALALTRSRN